MSPTWGWVFIHPWKQKFQCSKSSQYLIPSSNHFTDTFMNHLSQDKMFYCQNIPHFSALIFSTCSSPKTSNTWPQQQKKTIGHTHSIEINIHVLKGTAWIQYKQQMFVNYIKIVLASAIESNIKNPCIHFFHHCSAPQVNPAKNASKK